MAIALTTGTGQTTNVTAAQTLVMPTSASYKLLRNSPNESVYSNIAGLLDQPNRIRHAVTTIDDAFKNTGVNPITGQRTDGLSLLTQIVETWKVEDAANTAFTPYYLPVSAHFVLKFPKDSLITSAVLGAFYLRMAGAMFAAAGNTVPQAIDPLLREVTLLR